METSNAQAAEKKADLQSRLLRFKEEVHPTPAAPFAPAPEDQLVAIRAIDRSSNGSPALAG